MQSWIKQLLTGKDNQTHDIGRWSWIISMVAVLGSAGWNAAHAAVIDVMALAQAIGVVVAAHGGALFVKQQTEPDK